jgi:hypothetical protein
VQIRSGEGTDTLGVDGGQAARVGLYVTDRLGSVVCSGTELARGSVSATYARTGAATAPVTFYVLRNTSASRIVRVHRIIVFPYSGNISGGVSTLKAQFDHYRNVTGVTGGTTAQTPAIFKTSLGQATAIDCSVMTSTSVVSDTLVLTDGVKIGEIGSFHLSSGVVAATAPQWNVGPFQLCRGPKRFFEPFDLAQNEAIVAVQPLVVMGPGAGAVITAFFSEIAV